jgi:hypothetical protein
MRIFSGVREMKRLYLASALFLAGCQTPITGTVEVDPRIVAAQETVSKICGFVPDDGVVSELIKFFKPDTAGYLAMAQQICAAVSAPQLLGRRSSTPKLHGVRITGRFVR